MPDGEQIEPKSPVATSKILPARSTNDRFDLGLLACRQNLKAYACSLSRDVDVADDLVQETLLRALANRDKFKRGTNMRAWLFTILKNLFRSKLRRDCRETPLSDAVYNGPALSISGAQEETLILKELTRQLRLLPRAQANAVLLVGAWGYSVDDVSQRENCPAGTIKSRVSRGRRTLAAKLL